MRYDVCASVVSDLQYDARAWKEARSLARAGYRVALIGCRYDLASTTRRAVDSIDVVEIPLGKKTNRRNVLRLAAALIRLWYEVLRTRARIYHCHNVHPAPAAWLAARIRGARLVYDGHELYGESTYRGVAGWIVSAATRFLEGGMVRRGDVVITTNPTRAAELQRRYGRREVVVLANVPERVDDLRSIDPGFPSGRKILLYQGGIYPSRAFDEVIRALTELSDFHFVVLGFGRQGFIDRLKAFAAERGLADRVTFLPARPFDELVSTATGATVGIVPIRSTTPGEYSGDTNKLHEYLMAGLPVAASDLPEMRRVLNEGNPHVGELFDPSVPASIAGAVRRLVDDSVAYEARRSEARRIALQKFNWRIEEVKLLAAYEALPAASPDRARLTP